MSNVQRFGTRIYKKEKIDIATKLKKENISVEIIAKTTGLSIEKISNI